MATKQELIDRGVPPIIADLLTKMGMEAVRVTELPLTTDSVNYSETAVNELRKLRVQNAPDPRSMDGSVNIDRHDVIDILHALQWVHEDIVASLDNPETPWDTQRMGLAIDGKIHRVANKLIAVLDGDLPLTTIPF